MRYLVASLILVLSPSLFLGQKSELHRTDIQNVLGEPIQVQGNQSIYRTKAEDMYVTAEFTPQDVVIKLVISSSCLPREALNKKLDRVVPRDVRGKYLRRKPVGEIGGCRIGYQDEYENLVISYSETNCMNCNHPQLVVEWRKVEGYWNAPSNNSFNASAN
jgi:hypothetical protein